MTFFWSKKQILSYVIKKLKDKKQAFQEVSIFYGIKNTDQDEIGALKNKKVNISTKKTGLKSNSADWRPVYKNLDSEIKLLHYSPKILEGYRGRVRQLQGFARSKDPQLLSSTDVKDFLTYLVLDDMWLMYKIKV